MLLLNVSSNTAIEHVIFKPISITAFSFQVQKTLKKIIDLK